jgi:hypothetical protein
MTLDRAARRLSRWFCNGMVPIETRCVVATIAFSTAPIAFSRA